MEALADNATGLPASTEVADAVPEMLKLGINFTETVLLLPLSHPGPATDTT